MTQEQLDLISKDLIKTIKILKGNPNQNGLLFELGIIKKEIEEYNSQKNKNNIYHLILIGSVCFLFGWIACTGFYNIKPPVIQSTTSINNSNTKLKKEDIGFVSVNEFEKKFNEFKFNGKTLEYKGKIFNEGDSIGNIRIEYIIPDVHIRVWDIKEGYPFVKEIINKDEKEGYIHEKAR